MLVQVDGLFPGGDILDGATRRLGLLPLGRHVVHFLVGGAGSAIVFNQRCLALATTHVRFGSCTARRLALWTFGTVDRDFYSCAWHFEECWGEEVLGEEMRTKRIGDGVEEIKVCVVDKVERVKQRDQSTSSKARGTLYPPT